ncbi:transposase family protein [Nostoc sphaeroides CHAB 2801]|uniref:helix-turn-helix domain-containing protein n=1 Tax=Nostoc sphaeroides TaxID=446679 RepID=UPI001E3A4A88|nr:transposase family protein [Nostoc sphaeroides]MCC5632955.1 transposase family protein [Nostoc sphaeroides CHAB 2801]
MNNILKHIEENPKETQRLIGLEYEQLQQLIQNAERLHYEKQALLESQKVRIIAGGGGRKQKLSLREQIILTLVYLRHLTTFQLLGIQFGVSESIGFYEVEDLHQIRVRWKNRLQIKLSCGVS